MVRPGAHCPGAGVRGGWSLRPGLPEGLLEPDAQKQIFAKQLHLAIRLNKPLLIHERSAQHDLLEILDKYGCSLPLFGS